MLGWLHFGKVPILVILVIFLTAFAVTGFVVQFAARAVIGSFMPLPIAVALAFVAAVFGVRVLGGALSKVIPRDETTAVSDASLVGRVGNDRDRDRARRQARRSPRSRRARRFALRHGGAGRRPIRSSNRARAFCSCDT